MRGDAVRTEPTKAQKDTVQGPPESWEAELSVCQSRPVIKEKYKRISLRNDVLIFPEYKLNKHSDSLGLISLHAQ